MPDPDYIREARDAFPTAARPQATIALTRFSEPDWLLAENLEHLACQKGITAEVLMLDQKPSEAIAAKCAELQSTAVRFRYETIPARNLSYARNQAVEKAATDAILFLDADAMAGPNWARLLYDALTTQDVGLVGARILPTWHRKPLLVARSPIIQDQYSIFDLGVETRPYHRVVGASFGLHRGRLEDEAYFDERLGRRVGSLLGGEESDLSRRVVARGLSILYVGEAFVHHQIMPDRVRYRWILHRLYYAGYGRAILGGAPNPSRSTAIWDYLASPIILPPFAVGYLMGRWTAAHQPAGSLDGNVACSQKTETRDW